MGFFQFFDKRVGVVSWYGQNTNIFAHLLHLDNVRLLYFLQNHIFRLKSSEKYWKSNCLLQVNFENRNRVNWHQLMFYIKWWVFVIIKMPCFHIYNIFKCHFKPNQKCQRDMNDPVVCLLLRVSSQDWNTHEFLLFFVNWWSKSYIWQPKSPLFFFLHL